MSVDSAVFSVISVRPAERQKENRRTAGTVRFAGKKEIFPDFVPDAELQNRSHGTVSAAAGQEIRRNSAQNAEWPDRRSGIVQTVDEKEIRQNSARIVESRKKVWIKRQAGTAAVDRET